jgi:hypothetical protein
MFPEFLQLIAAAFGNPTCGNWPAFENLLIMALVAS